MENDLHEDQRYINGLVANDSIIIQEIYKKFVPKVRHYVSMNSGDDDAAQDIVQEVLITIYNQAKTKGLQLTCPFDAYFFLLCKRKWLNELKKSSSKEVTNSNETVFNNKVAEDLAEETELQNEKQRLFETMFTQLGEKCKELLKLSFAIKSLEEVAEKLNVTYAYVRKKKSLCTGKLTELIQQSPQFKTLKA